MLLLDAVTWDLIQVGHTGSRAGNSNITGVDHWLEKTRG